MPSEHFVMKNIKSYLKIDPVYRADGYNYGIYGFAKDEAKALKWYLCGEDTDLYCKYRAAILLLFKIGKEKADFEKGIKLLKYCSEAGYRDSVYLLANCCLYGHGTYKDPMRAGWYLSRILNFDPKYPDWMNSYLPAYIYPKAYRLMLKLAEYRKKQSLYTLPQTQFYDEGNDLCIQLYSHAYLSEENAEMIEHCINAIETLGYPEGIVLMERRLFWTYPKRERLINYFKNAVAAGKTTRYLAIVLDCHFKGNLSERDYWIEESLKQRCVDAADEIADEYRNQAYDCINNVPETCWKTAVELYLKTGEAGSSYGYYRAAECYSKGGYGIEKNEELSRACLRRAAELQSEPAIEELLNFYTSQDKTKAEYYAKLYEEGKWFRDYLNYDDICGLGRKFPESIVNAKIIATECKYYEENFPFDDFE